LGRPPIDAEKEATIRADLRQAATGCSRATIAKVAKRAA
jgi:hypothetical protein